MGAQKRKRILDEATTLVSSDRNASYGEPEDNFGNIAAIWNAQGVQINGRDVNASDVALMMVGMKLARLKHNPGHRDSWVDGAGYLACGGDIALPTEFADWEKLGYVDETQMTPERPVSADVAEAARLKYAGGWQTDNRCGERLNPIDVDRFGANPHAGHTYGNGGAYWCDGYVAPLVPVRQGESDLDVVKRVADKLTQNASRTWCTGSGIHQGCGPACEVPRPRPIKDCPQA